MAQSRAIEIVGGGLAGLSLGVALRRAGVPVTIFDAGVYPRHRVCGEFIAGLKDSTANVLGLHPFFHDALRNETALWHARDRPIGRHTMPRATLSISRHALDARLAEAFRSLGGCLRERERVDLKLNPPGRVFACGRRARTGSPWFGVKMHVHDLPLDADLEFHLGDHAYFGLCRVENGAVNVCGLLRREGPSGVGGVDFVSAALRERGLAGLASRLVAAEIDRDSFVAVAGMSYEATPAAVATDRIDLGDAFSTIPPFSGSGMSLAFESAECALSPLKAWAEGRQEWPATLATTMKAVRGRFTKRVWLARALHPYLISRRRQAIFRLAQRARLLPLRAVAVALHS